MKIVSWNVNGIRAVYKKGLMDIIESMAPDILCLQETKAHREQVETPAQDLGYRQAYWSSATKKGYSGVATFLDQTPIQVKTGFGFPEYDSEGRIVWTELPDFDLYNIYFPNGGSGDARHAFKQQFLKDLLNHLKSEIQKNKKIILVGDYNIAHKPVDIYDPVRLAKESGFLPEEREWFDQFVAAGFVDTFRHFYPEAKQRYSWWSYRELARVSNRGWRIDYICVTQNLVSQLKSADILDQVQGSDHCPVVIDIMTDKKG